VAPKASQREPVRRTRGDDLSRSLARARQEPGNNCQPLGRATVVSARRSLRPVKQPRYNPPELHSIASSTRIAPTRQVSRETVVPSQAEEIREGEGGGSLLTQTVTASLAAFPGHQVGALGSLDCRKSPLSRRELLQTYVWLETRGRRRRGWDTA
jgi:hypothetical protein